MPTYEYYCQACEHEWEREQRIHAAPVKTCPKCKARKAKRMISQTSFVLKGSGWHSDLYSSTKDSKPKSEGDTKAPSGEDGGAKKGKSDKSKPGTGGDKSKPGGGKKGKGSGSKAAA